MPTSSIIYTSKEEIESDKLLCWLEINLSYLKNNIESIRNIILDKLDICCVVKANSYRLGAINISKYLASIGIKYFSVATLEEALELHKPGEVPGEIIILSWTPVSEKETLIKNNLTLTLIDYDFKRKSN